MPYTIEQEEELKKLESKIFNLSNRLGFWGCVYTLFNERNGWQDICINKVNMVIYETEEKKMVFIEDSDNFTVTFYSRNGTDVKIEYKMKYEDIANKVSKNNNDDTICILTFITQQCFLFINNLPLFVATGYIKQQLGIEMV